MCQWKYSLEHYEIRLLGGNNTKTPMQQNLKLASRGYDENFGLNAKDTLLSDPTLYTKLVRKLLYLTITILDINF